jgi:hypothetical protein
MSKPHSGERMYLLIVVQFFLCFFILFFFYRCLLQNGIVPYVRRGFNNVNR